MWWESRSIRPERRRAALRRNWCGKSSREYGRSGVPLRNIVVYDRFGYEMDLGSYQALMPPGVEVVGMQDGLLDASGYDANVYCEMNFFGEWETRSYMASIVANATGQNYQRADIERPLGFGSDRMPEECGVRDI